MNRGGSYGGPGSSARYNGSTRSSNYNNFAYHSPAARGFNSPSTIARNDGGWHSFGPGNSMRGSSPSSSNSGNLARNGAEPLASSSMSHSFSPPGSNVAHPSFAGSTAAGSSRFGSDSFASSRFSETTFNSSRFAGNHGAPLGAGTAARFGPSASVVSGSHFGGSFSGSSFNNSGHSTLTGNIHSSYIYGGYHGGWGGYGWHGYGGWYGYHPWGWGWGWGWGFGIGFGWGWGWGGWWGSPYWWGPGWGGYWGWGYPYWGYPAYGGDSYSSPCPPGSASDFSDYCGTGGVDYNLNSIPPQNNYNSSIQQPANQENGSGPGALTLEGSPNENPLTGNVAASTPTVLLYLKDGTMFVATDYWMANDQLHYIVSYAGESTIPLNQLDWQRTVDENAKRGIRFSLKNRPDTASSAPASSSPADDTAPAVLPGSPPSTLAPAPSAPPTNSAVSPT
jgi:hypothetical protein